MKADLVYHSDGIDLLTSKDRQNISKPQKLLALRRGQRGGRRLLVPLPARLGLVHLGYLILTVFCFASMGNGVNLTDGPDGWAGGVCWQDFYFLMGTRLQYLWVILDPWHWVEPLLQWPLAQECSSHYLYLLCLFVIEV